MSEQDPAEEAGTSELGTKVDKEEDGYTRRMRGPRDD